MECSLGIGIFVNAPGESAVQPGPGPLAHSPGKAVLERGGLFAAESHPAGWILTSELPFSSDTL